ncbi:MAG: hypothetical protein QOH47_609 [Sphingomonadales bacterium]|jgi:hypothetical protein|nr:hypothetical protein [Sphingomonadales bacterium]
MIDWALASPAIGGLIGTIAMLIFVHRIQAKAKRARDRERAERKRLISP